MNVEEEEDDDVEEDDAEEEDRSQDREAHTLCEPAQTKCTWTCHQRHFVRKFSGKMPYAYPAASILRELAQSKCTWTSRGILCGNLQGKCRTLPMPPRLNTGP